MSDTCKRCLKTFKYPYLLRRHLSRKNACESVKGEYNKSLESQKQLMNNISFIQDEIGELKIKCSKIEETHDKISKLEDKINLNSSQELNKLQCDYCRMKFARQDYLSDHIKKGRCKAKNDNIVIYERELGINADHSVSALTCRFCKYTFTTKQALSRHKSTGCNHKQEYEEKLKYKVMKNRQEVATTIINNNTTNNHQKIIINLPPMHSFDDTMKNVDYLTTKLLLKELQKHRSLNSNDISGIVDSFTKLIHANPAHPENHNVLFKSLNSGFARVYNGQEFEDRHSIEIQDRIVQNVGHLIDKTCDSYDYETEKNNIGEVLDQLDENFGEQEESIDRGVNSRQLSQCRNAVKAALHSNKDNIHLTQKLIE